MNYAKNGSLRKYLPSIIKFNWLTKLRLLSYIIKGLKGLHNSDLVHNDLHDGNILMSSSLSWISDLGLCKPISYFHNSSTKNKNDVYGVLPYIAPEVLRGKPYTQASDIYSFSMIMWEFISGVPPFDDRAHDLQLSLSICKGERPKIPEITKTIPKCYINLMKKCWDSDPLKRPTPLEISNIIHGWCISISNFYYDFRKSNIDHENIKDYIDEIINRKTYLNESQRNEIKEFWKADKALAEEQASTLPFETSNHPNRKSHPQAYRTSRLLDFTKKLNEILDQEEKEIFDYKNVQDIESRETGISQSIGNY
jgi:serine/threonine protein kinase